MYLKDSRGIFILKVTYSMRDNQIYEDQDSPLTAVLVKNLTYNIRSAHVHEIFSNFGEVKQVQIAYFKGHSSGWAYVYFAGPDEAENAVQQMDGGYIDGVQISVSLTTTNISIEEAFLNQKEKNEGNDSLF